MDDLFMNEQLKCRERRWMACLLGLTVLLGAPVFAADLAIERLTWAGIKLGHDLPMDYSGLAIGMAVGLPLVLH